MRPILISTNLISSCQVPVVKAPEELPKDDTKRKLKSTTIEVPDIVMEDSKVSVSSVEPSETMKN